VSPSPVTRSLRSYLSVEDRRDVIEQPIVDDLDVSGWELRKALRLLRKSNPPLLEWLKSPVVYRHDPVFAAEFGTLATEFYSPRRCCAHYLRMAFGNWRDYLPGREEVSLKKYLYVFRPLLACRWVERRKCGCTADIVAAWGYFAPFSPVSTLMSSAVVPAKLRFASCA
jgi:predicted nucleotidyltransferase